MRDSAVTVFIAIGHGFQARMLLRTDVLGTLKASGARIVILSLNAQEEYFRREFEIDGVVVEPLINRAAFLERQFDTIRYRFLGNPKYLRTLNIQHEKYRLEKPVKYALAMIINRLIGRYKPVREVWLRLQDRLYPDRDHAQVFDKYRADVLLTGTPGFFLWDSHLLRRARKMGILTVSLPMSWDFLTSKGQMSPKPDKLIVWGEMMRDEAIEYHDFPVQDIVISGPPHFDIYAHTEQYHSREEFCRQVGLDPARKIIFLGLGPNIFNADFVQIFKEAIRTSKFIEPCQLLVRTHPRVNPLDLGKAADDLKRLADAGVVIETPQIISEQLPSDLPASDMQHLAECIYHSAVTVNLASTLSLDAAALDRPIVCLGFDGFQTRPYPVSVVRYYDYTHYRPIVESGGVRIARSPEELIACINTYLADPALDREGRRRMIEHICYKVDGHAGERVAQFILNWIKERR